MSNAMIGAKRWWTGSRRLSVPELVADGVVHGVGIAMALGLGGTLIVLAYAASVSEAPALLAYVAALVALLSISMAFNLCPPDWPAKRALARLDQAAIFVFIATSYTPFVLLLGLSPFNVGLMIAVWVAALTGVALKLFVPHRFGRGAVILYLALGWSGLFMVKGLMEQVAPLALVLLVAGGLSYTVGVVFLMWERLKFNLPVWHGFVVLGATLHLVAAMECVVLNR